MTHSEQEEVLRRALHAVADTIEPAADGLERIRERLSRPRPLPVAWVMAAWSNLVQAVQLRLEPDAEGQPGRLGSWLRLAARYLEAVGGWLRPAVEALLGAARALRPGSGMSRHEKLRSALAFGAAALIGAAGGFALSAGLPQQVISAAQSAFSSGSTHHSGGGGRNGGTSAGTGQHLQTPQGSTPGSTRKSPSPSASCKQSTPPAGTSPLPPVSPSASPSTSPPTIPPTTNPGSPTPTPTLSSGTPTPTPTPTPGAVGPSTAPNQSSHGTVTGTGTPNPTPIATGAINQTAAGAHPAASASKSPRAKRTC